MQKFDHKNLIVKGFTKRIKFFAVLFFAALLSVTTAANVYNVTNTTDGTGVDQLRGAIMAADALGGTHTINVAAGTYVLTLGEIIFGNTAQNITIVGAGSASTIISMTTGDGKDRIFFINPSGTTNSPVITVQGIKFENGYLTSDPYGGAAICAGGGTDESLTLIDCVFDNNILPAGAFGGAAVCMQISGDLTVDNCVFTNNVSNDVDGGAILFIIFNGWGYSGDLLVTNSTFTGNSVNRPGDGTSDGGAIAFSGQGTFEGTFNVTINNNTFIGNTADGLGGAISANNSPDLSTSQIHFNRFYNNTSAVSALSSALHFVESAGSVNAENNWWGCNTNPVNNSSTSPCNQAGGDLPGGGSLDADPWLQLKVTASPATICSTTPSNAGNTSTVTASFLNNSDGTAIPVDDLSELIGLNVTWSSTLGSLSGQQATIQPGGTATATFTSNGTAGTATVNAQVDNVPSNEATPARASITVNSSSTAPTGAAGITTICNGSSTTLTVDGGLKGLGATTEWFTGSCGGTAAGSGDAITVSPTTTTTYYVRYTGACNTTECATVTVTVNTLSTAPTGATGTTTICSGSSTTLTVNGGSKGTGASTEWFTGSCGGTLVFTGDVFTTPALSSSQIYYVRYSGTCNTTTCASVAVTVNPRPTVNAPGIVQPTCATLTGTITVNASGSGILEYSIDGGANWSGTNVFSGLAPGNYNISVRSQSAPTCVADYSGNPVVLIAATNCCTPTCSNSNPVLYFGYPGDQTSTVTVSATGGTAPYTVPITMNRPLNCNVVTSSGDELWVASSGTSTNNVCPASGSASLVPVSTGTIAVSGGTYSIDVTLMQDATFTATITDATGCVRTCTTFIDAEDVRCFGGNSGITKVGICHQTGNNGNPCINICVPESSLAEHLAHGDFVGNCTSNCIGSDHTRGAITQTPVTKEETAQPTEKVQAENTTVKKPEIKKVPVSADMFRVRVTPNPTNSHFTLEVESGSNEKISVIIYDVLGRLVKHTENSRGQLIRFGEDLKVGAYMAIVMQGINVRTIKLVKQ